MIDVGKASVCGRRILGNAPLSSICLINENALAIGDDDGRVYIVDTRDKLRCAWEKDLGVDYVSDLLHLAHRKSVVASSGDGRLSVLDLRKCKVIEASDSLDEEIKCLEKLGADGIIAATDCGSLAVYEWGKIDSFKNRSYIHACSINDILQLQGKDYITAGDDGLIRQFEISQPSNSRVIAKLDDSVERICLAGAAVASTTCGSDVYLHAIAVHAQEASADKDERAHSAEASFFDAL